MRFPSRFVLTCLLLYPGSNALHAQEQADVHPYLTDTFFIDLGVFFPDRDTRVRVDGTISGDNRDIDFDRATGVKETDEVGSIDVGWRFARKWSLHMQHFSSSGATQGALTEDIEWKDIVFEEGTRAVVGQDFSATRVFFGYQFNSSARHDFGAGLGFHQIEFTGFIEGNITTPGGGNEFRREIVSVEQPLPNIGIWYRYSWSPNWMFRSRFDWVDARVDIYDGSLTNASIGINYKISRHFGMGLNYHALKLDVTIDKSDWRGRLEQRFVGAHVYVSAYW